MKKLLLALMVLFVSLNFVACAEKKDNKTRLTKGAGRVSDAAGTPAGSGWSVLNARSELTELYSVNPTSTAQAFLGEGVGTINMNAVSMKLSFDGNGRALNTSKIGLRFLEQGVYRWDQAIGWYVGSEMGATVTGQKNGNQVRVVFNDGVGDITIIGYIQGNTFNGTVTYDGGQNLGEFNISNVSYAIYN